MTGEQKTWNTNPAETRGWEIVRQINSSPLQLPLQRRGGSNGDALVCRRLLAEYFKLGTHKPSRLHSAILSCAVRMALVFPDFHLVPFLDIWGLENLRPEDSEVRVGDDGKRFPSLVEKMIRAYAYSLLFHPEEHLEPEYEQMLKPTLIKKGYCVDEVEGRLQIVSYVLATRVFLSDVRNRKMTFVSLLTPLGDDFVTEVHTVTQFSKMRYETITNSMFRVVLRTSDNGNIRVEAAFLSDERVEEKFPTSVGYIEHVDTNHHHIHVYDNESRHMVSKYEFTTNIQEGDFVRFVPVLPKEGNFKSAIITSVLRDGAEAFGYRNVQVTFVSEDQEYCAWELLPQADGQVRPIIETGTKEPQEPATKGYINKSVVQKVQGAQEGFKLPNKGDKLQIITFLKRGKDKKKRPFVVWFRAMQ